MASSALDRLATIVKDHCYSYFPSGWFEISTNILTDSLEDNALPEIHCDVQLIEGASEESPYIFQESYIVLDDNSNITIHSEEPPHFPKKGSILKSSNPCLKVVSKPKHVTFKDTNVVHLVTPYQGKGISKPQEEPSVQPVQLVDLTEEACEHSRLGTLDRLSREAYAYAVKHTREETEANIVENQARMKVLQNSPGSGPTQQSSRTFQNVKLSPSDITRIKELFPPDNFKPLKSDEHNLPKRVEPGARCIRACPVDEPVPETTVRCISNYAVHSCAGGRYQTDGDYFGTDTVNYLPEPSIWTPQHTLMNTAPCISSPGFFQNNYSELSCIESSDSTDTDEENAIY